MYYHYTYNQSYVYEKQCITGIIIIAYTQPQQNVKYCLNIQQHCLQRHALLLKAIQNGIHRSKIPAVGTKIKKGKDNPSFADSSSMGDSPDPEPLASSSISSGNSILLAKRGLY